MGKPQKLNSFKDLGILKAALAQNDLQADFIARDSKKLVSACEKINREHGPTLVISYSKDKKVAVKVTFQRKHGYYVRHSPEWGIRIQVRDRELVTITEFIKIINFKLLNQNGRNNIKSPVPSSGRGTDKLR